ncbi:hypothetical protein PRIPAC_81276 [Pristionchus pacificus]|uniref:Trypsin n=1 Tax=Pristionchus pacificus TaxID=54126 RepID=A0A2A6CP02_PRIPA|nr:hypothetical protein PRIPAC_81276 [Pristionchus pacificus]|eukprot:PDM79807.1 Trypsin [Pristionchus pacificus]
MHLLLLISLTTAAAAAEQACGQVKVNPVGAAAAVAQTGNAVTGGSETADGAWPWIVSICRMDWFGACQFHAAGTIISDKWIVTSLSGIDPALMTRYRIRAGSTSNTYGGQFVQLEHIVHPKTANTVEHKADIALIELHTPLQFNDFVQPICLPGNDEDVVASGAGPVQTYLRQAQMRIMTNGLGCPAYFDNTTQICGGGGNGGTACTFDVGGPLMQQRVTDGRWFLCGIAAMMSEFGMDGCTRPSIFNRVSSFCEYIQQTSSVSCQQ